MISAVQIVAVALAVSLTKADIGTLLTCQQYEQQVDPCGISGRWINELGSCAIFYCGCGYIFGLYNSKVGDAESWYKLAGTYTPGGLDDKDSIIGFSVAYNNMFGNSHSVASWAGSYYKSNDTIYTMWLLNRYEPLDSYWSSTLVNQDMFNRDDAKSCKV